MVGPSLSTRAQVYVFCDRQEIISLSLQTPPFPAFDQILTQQSTNSVLKCTQLSQKTQSWSVLNLGMQCQVPVGQKSSDWADEGVLGDQDEYPDILHHYLGYKCPDHGTRYQSQAADCGHRISQESLVVFVKR